MLIDGNMIMSGFVSKGVNNLVDFGWKKIKDANRQRKSHEQNIETRIYQVTVDAINAFTFNKYKEQDTLYIAAESILKGFKNKKDKIEAVKAGLKILESQVTDDRCADFLGILCDEICKDENDILYKEINIKQNEQIIEDVDKGFKRSEQNQEYIREDIHKVFERSEQNHQETQRKLDYLVEKADEKDANFYGRIRVENRAEEYAAKWDKNVFLNNFDEEDENHRIEVKLSKIYKDKCLPHYIWKFNTKESDKLYNLLKKYVINNDGKKMLLILGQPGIGKSTLITWMMANFEEKRDDFLVYQFASELKNVYWQNNDILSYIIQNLGLKYDELENKILILDGFDEIQASSYRERILNGLNQEVRRINNLRNFCVVITCRENYVSELEKLECDFITLQAWDDDQIRCFCEAYSKESKSDISTSKIDKLLKNKEVFGIPIILYMVLALDITIEKNESLVDVFDQIFSIERSSIYDRCIKNSRYDREHRISEDEIKQLIHQISQRIAFWIFENNSEKAFIPQKEYETICDSVINQISNTDKDIKRDFLIGNYFKLVKHCDGVGTQELHFIHRSLYEYFVAVCFYESLHRLTTKEEVAGELGELLKAGHLSEQILVFIKYKFDKLEGNNLCDITREVFNKMLHDGMTYYVKEKYRDIIVQETNIFANMLEVVHSWNPKLGKLDNKLVCYLQFNHMANLNLSYVDLSETDLSEANLTEANLSEANLRCTDLSGADLKRADLTEADLRYADLRGADLREAELYVAKLRGTDLRGANLYGANLIRADLREANLIGANFVTAILNRAILIGTDLRGANLSRADLIGANLKGVILSKVNLRGADLRRANLKDADLIGADLRDADLRDTDLRDADLRGADLGDAALSDTALSGEDLFDENFYDKELNDEELKEALLTGTIFDEKQVELLQDKCDLSNSRVFTFEINQVISYKEYCIRKQN